MISLGLLMVLSGVVEAHCYTSQKDRSRLPGVIFHNVIPATSNKDDPATSGSVLFLIGGPKQPGVSALSYSRSPGDGELKFPDALFQSLSGRTRPHAHNRYLDHPLPNSSGLSSTATEVSRVPTVSDAASRYPGPEKDPGVSTSHGASYRSSSRRITSPTPQDGGLAPFKPPFLHAFSLTDLVSNTSNNEETSSEDPASPAENKAHTSHPPPYVSPSRFQTEIAPDRNSKPFLISIPPTYNKVDIGQADMGYPGSLNEALTRIKRQIVKPPPINSPRYPPPPDANYHFRRG